MMFFTRIQTRYSQHCPPWFVYLLLSNICLVAVSDSNLKVRSKLKEKVQRSTCSPLFRRKDIHSKRKNPLSSEWVPWATRYHGPGALFYKLFWIDFPLIFRFSVFFSASEPNLKVRLALKQKMIERRSSPLMRRKEKTLVRRNSPLASEFIERNKKKKSVQNCCQNPKSITHVDIWENSLLSHNLFNLCLHYCSFQSINEKPHISIYLCYFCGYSI